MFKGRVQCFSMQVVMNKCFFLNFEIKFALIHFVVFEKKKHFNSKNITSPNRRLSYSYNQLNTLKVSFRLSETILLKWFPKARY